MRPGLHEVSGVVVLVCVISVRRVVRSLGADAEDLTICIQCKELKGAMINVI